MAVLLILTSVALSHLASHRECQLHAVLTSCRELQGDRHNGGDRAPARGIGSSHPAAHARLEVYEALWHLVQVHHWRPEYISMPDPAVALRHLLTGGFRERLDVLLAPVRERSAGEP